MKLLALAAFAAALTTNAIAADLAIEAAPAAVPVAAPSDWTGLYAGVHIGYAKGATTNSLECGNFGVLVGSVTWVTGTGYGCSADTIAVTSLVNNVDDAPWLASDDLSDMTGWLAGVQAGYRQQFGGVVLGAELSGSISNISDMATTWIFGTNLNQAYSSSLSVDWLLLGTANAGFVLGDNFLVSAMGGVALGGLNLDGFWGDTASAIAPGYTVGAQAEVRLSDEVSVFAAYNYVYFGDVQYETVAGGGLASSLYEYDTALHIVKVGLNYAFR